MGTVQMKRKGRFGPFGGRYVPESLYPALEELDDAFLTFKRDQDFKVELRCLLSQYAGRPTPLYHAENLSKKWGARVYLKREDLLHTGAHKLNNCLGQALLAKRLGKTKIIAETGAGQHGVATATVCALLGLQCRVYMGAVDMERQRPNVLRMNLLGAEVIGVESGSRTLKDATNEAIRDWVATVKDSHYIIGSTVGPHPYPKMVAHFQAVIGRESRRQILAAERRLPEAVVACVGGGSNAIGIFRGFVRDKSVRLIGVEAGGSGTAPGKNAATLASGRPGILHGAYSYLIQDKAGQVIETHSISAGLDYPGVGPEHAWLKEKKRASYRKATDKAALAAFKELAAMEGILPALESSHALAGAKAVASRLDDEDSIVLVNLSGRGDKDLESVGEALKREEEGR